MEANELFSSLETFLENLRISGDEYRMALETIEEYGEARYNEGYEAGYESGIEEGSEISE